MAFRRLPRFVGGAEAPDGVLSFPDMVDLHPRDTVVFAGGRVATVSSVEHSGSGTRAVLGKDPACKPRPHSGKSPPTKDAEGRPL